MRCNIPVHLLLVKLYNTDGTKVSGDFALSNVKGEALYVDHVGIRRLPDGGVIARSIHCSQRFSTDRSSSFPKLHNNIKKL